MPICRRAICAQSSCRWILPDEVFMPTSSETCIKSTRHNCRPFCCLQGIPRHRASNYSATIRTLEKLKYTHRRRLSKACPYARPDGKSHCSHHYSRKPSYQAYRLGVKHIRPRLANASYYLEMRDTCLPQTIMHTRACIDLE